MKILQHIKVRFELPHLNGFYLTNSENIETFHTIDDYLDHKNHQKSIHLIMESLKNSHPYFKIMGCLEPETTYIRYMPNSRGIHKIPSGVNLIFILE